jgi:hypothetical protein
VRIAAIYIAVTHGIKTSDFCARFAATWHQFQPGYPCDLIVACQGGPLDTETALLFSGLNARFWPRVNDGARDLGAYIEASKTICKNYDMLLALGESNYFHRAGWLKRLVEVRERYGLGMYGPFATHVIRAHLQTTAFFITPSLLASYPFPVTDRKSRYALEHGDRSLWRRLHARNIPVKLVTWDGDWSPGQWRLPQNCLWRGDQSNCLWFSNHTQNFQEADETRKRNWAMSADRAYR